MSKGIFNVVTGKHSGAESGNVKDELGRHTRIAVGNINIIFKKYYVMIFQIVNLSAVFILISFYISMIMTNWGTSSVDANANGSITSMWMQAIGAWLAAGLYVVGLILPAFKFLPESIWDLQPKI